MPTLPSAKTTVSATAGSPASGVDLICLMAPVPTLADIKPRLFGKSEDIFTSHGYSEGVEYAALHMQKTRLPVLFVGLPIDTAGVVGRENTEGNTGTSVTTVVAGGDGVLTEHDGVLTVATGGTIGTDQIILLLSLDGGKVTKRVRLGTAVSYVIPYIGVTLNFAAGTLVADDVVHTWHGTGPRSASSDWAAARTALGNQTKAFRSWLLTGDLQTDTEATAMVTQLNAYETVNKRYVYGRSSVRDRLPLAAMSLVSSVMTGSPTLTFTEVGATGDTITRSSGSWITDGFQVGDTVVFAGTVSNNVTVVIDSLSATVITLDAEDLADEVGPSSATAVATPTLTFATSGDTITRNRGSWLADGFRIGDIITPDGTASNDGEQTLAITGVTSTVITCADNLTDEVIGTAGVTITAGQTKAIWMADIDAEFAPVDDEFRLDLSAGRGRIESPFDGWHFRRPAAWAASLREYQHDLHVTTWRNDNGPLGFDLYDDDQNLVEWDDEVDGGAGLAARFTVMRSWPNEQGAFIAMSLTRATEGSILQQTQNVAVINLAQTVTQFRGQKTVGRDLVLNDDGTATADELEIIRSEIDGALELELLTDRRGEGQRASNAFFTPSSDDIFNIPEATLTGVVAVNFKGVIHTFDVSIRALAGG